MKIPALTEEEKAVVLGDASPGGVPIEELERSVKELQRRRDLLRQMAALSQEVAELEQATGTMHQYLHLMVQAVSAEFKVEAGEIMGRCRQQDVSLARQVVFYLARELTQGSSPQIGRLFRRDHGTILFGLKAVENRMAIQPHFKARVEKLEADCAGQILQAKGHDGWQLDSNSGEAK